MTNTKEVVKAQSSVTIMPKMTVKTLMRFLKEFDPNAVVVLASDEEGNNYSPLASICDGKYSPHDNRFDSEATAPNANAVALFPSV